MTCQTALLFLLVASASTEVSSFAPQSHRSRLAHPTIPPAYTQLAAMERLHDTSTNSYSIEHVYTHRDIDFITRRIARDEWTALGSVIAETMHETILDVGNDALKQRSWTDRITLTDRIAEEVSSAVEKTLYNIRSQPSSVFDHGPHSLPEELLNTLHTLLRTELGLVIGLDEGTPFDYDGRDLSLLVLSSVSEAIELYCGITNINAPFFNLATEMNHRVRDRRRELLVKHSKGYESVKDLIQDIESSRKVWVREVLGSKAASNYEFGEVTTKDGNEHSHLHLKEKKARKNRQTSILNALFQDLDGVLLP